MFVRDQESQGVYEFGSRRVMIKVVQDRLQVKIGGGFVPIDEFL